MFVCDSHDYMIVLSHCLLSVPHVLSGATLSKGVNRGVGTLLACLLAVLVGQLASMSGDLAHPIIVGVSVFIIGM